MLPAREPGGKKEGNNLAVEEGKTLGKRGGKKSQGGGKRRYIRAPFEGHLGAAGVIAERGRFEGEGRSAQGVGREGLGKRVDGQTKKQDGKLENGRPGGDSKRKRGYPIRLAEIGEEKKEEGLSSVTKLSPKKRENQRAFHCQEYGTGGNNDDLGVRYSRCQKIAKRPHSARSSREKKPEKGASKKTLNYREWEKKKERPEANLRSEIKYPLIYARWGKIRQ